MSDLNNLTDSRSESASVRQSLCERLDDPMRFSIRHRNVNVGELLGPKREVTDITLRPHRLAPRVCFGSPIVRGTIGRPSQGDMYVHWRER